MIKEYLNCVNCAQTGCLVNSYCSQEWKEKINDHKSVVLYQKGQSIFCENSMVFGLYFIYEGKVKVFNSGGNDKQYILRLASSGEMLGMRAYGENKYRVSCTTLEDSTVCFIDKDFFIQAIRENPDLAVALIQTFAKIISLTDLRQKHLAHLCSKDRVAEALLIIKKYFGIPSDEGILLDVNLSRQDIANFAGISMEEIIRILAALKKEKIISYSTNSRKITILNPDKLMGMILKNYDNVYQQECCQVLL